MKTKLTGQYAPRPGALVLWMLKAQEVATNNMYQLPHAIYSLRKNEYFGKYGKIYKVVISNSTVYSGAQVGKAWPR